MKEDKAEETEEGDFDCLWDEEVLIHTYETSCALGRMMFLHGVLLKKVGQEPFNKVEIYMLTQW